MKSRFALFLLLSIFLISIAAGVFSFFSLGTLSLQLPQNPGIQDVKTVFEKRVNTELEMILGEPLPTLPAEPVYRLNDNDLVAPVADPNGFHQATDPKRLAAVLNRAKSHFGADDLLLTPETQVKDRSIIHYYEDDTIFTIVWKQVVDEGVYTFSEVLIADASQFRRFLSDGRYGSHVLRTTTEMSESVNAVVAAAGDYYSFRNAGIVVYNGQVFRDDGRHLDTCFVDAGGDLLFARAGELQGREAVERYVQENQIRFSLSFGPLILQNGELVAPREYRSGEIDTPYPRAALCQLGELHYVLVIANQEEGLYHMPRVREFAQSLQKMGISTAYCLDGGQTASIAVNHQLINRVSYGSQRKISDIIYFATAIPASGEDSQ